MAQSPGMIEHLEAGLRAARLRQNVIAHNIANLHTDGYRRAVVPFEDVFAQALERGKAVDAQTLVDHVVRPRTEPLNEHGNDVSLDTEVGDLIKNSLVYQTYMRVLGRMYRQMDAAIQTGSP